MPQRITTTLPAAPTGTAAAQAFDVGAMLEAIGWMIRWWTQLRDRVVEWDSDARPMVEGDNVISYRIVQLDPVSMSGGGRKGTPVVFTIQVSVWTAKRSDVTGDQTWFNRAHWGVCGKVIDALHDQHLYGSYDTTTGAGLTAWLTTAPVKFVPSQFADQNAGSQEYGVARLMFQVPTSLRLTI